MDRDREEGGRQRRHYGVILAFLLAAPAQALLPIEPCGDIPGEGICEGNVRKWCNKDQLQTETCAKCCTWAGAQYKCLETCPEPGACVDECLESTDVFGCSLQNTHEWTCEKGADGCIHRIFKKCATGQICDESTTHKCTDLGQVDLCAGISADGLCKGSVFKQCVGGALQTTDCAEAGQACSKGGCTSSCPIECLEGEQGCNASGQAWSCAENPANGCYIKVAKGCGIKTCIDGECVMPVEESPEPAQVDAGPVAAEPAPPPIATSPGGCLVSPAAETIGECSVAILATLLGVLIFLSMARRKRHSDEDRSE